MVFLMIESVAERNEARKHPEETRFRLLAREEGYFPCVVGKEFPAFPSHLKSLCHFLAFIVCEVITIQDCLLILTNSRKQNLLEHGCYSVVPVFDVI